MRTCYFYAQRWEEAVAALPPGAELVDVSRDFTAYWQEISARWGSDDMMIVEHDIAIHSQVISQFERCPNPWCVFPYWSDAWFDRALGCTRFRKEIQLAVTPGEIQHESWGCCWECNGEIDGCWRHIDGKICYSLAGLRGFTTCVHTPPVTHLTHPVPAGSTYVRERDDYSIRFPDSRFNPGGA